MKQATQFVGIIALTLFLGLMFLITPLPAVLSAGRPMLVFLILIYWALYCPDRVGVATAWVVGLLTDFLYGIMLGPYSLGFAVAIYLIVRLQSRLLMFPMFQQTVFIGMLIAGVQSVVLLLGVVQGRMEMPWAVLWSIPTTLLCWPIVTVILDSARGLCSEVK